MAEPNRGPWIIARRRGIVCGLIYLGLCGLAYIVGAVGNTDGSGLSYMWFALMLLPWIVAWEYAVPEPHVYVVVFSSMALNVSLIYWIAQGGITRRRPRRPKRWSVEIRGNFGSPKTVVPSESMGSWQTQSAPRTTC